MTLDGFVPWPSDLAHAYRVAGVWRGRPLGSYLWEWADRSGDRIALVDGGRALTYLELAAYADVLAERLAGLGLGRGDRILVQLPNGWEFVVLTLACFRLGVVPVMMLPSHREYELTSIGAHVRARALVVPIRWRGYDHQDLAHRVAAALPEPARVLVVGDGARPDSVDVHRLLAPAPPAPGTAGDPETAGGDPETAGGDPETAGGDPGTAGGRSRDAAGRRRWLDERAPTGSDVALFLLSGGTTGVPKVVGRTHDDYEYNIRCVVRACGIGPDSAYLAVLPAGHNFPLANPGILGTLFAGGRVVLLPSPRPDAAFAAIESARVTVTSVVPAVALKWMEAARANRRDLSSLRYLHVGGSVLAPEVAARIGPALGCRLQQVYGMAEGLICYTPIGAPDEVVHATQGAPVSPYDELLVVDPDGRPVAAGKVGELLTRGPYTPRGYYGAPGQNRVSFTGEGWYRTGDLVRRTPEGNLVVCGRIKDLINRAGEKISAGEVEVLVQELPEVAEAAAVPLPDPEVGERLCLFVRPRPGHEPTLAGIAAALTARGLAAFKIPERLEVLDELPHTAIGKPDKQALRRLLGAPSRPGQA